MSRGATAVTTRLQQDIEMENRDNNACEWEWPWYCHTYGYYSVCCKRFLLLGYTSDVSETLDGLFCCPLSSPSPPPLPLWLALPWAVDNGQSHLMQTYGVGAVCDGCCMLPKLAAVKPTGMFPGAGVLQYIHTYRTGYARSVAAYTYGTACVCLLTPILALADTSICMCLVFVASGRVTVCVVCCRHILQSRLLARGVTSKKKSLTVFLGTGRLAAKAH